MSGEVGANDSDICSGKVGRSYLGIQRNYHRNSSGPSSPSRRWLVDSRLPDIEGCSGFCTINVFEALNATKKTGFAEKIWRFHMASNLWIGS
jgi:hypothetical protein